MRSAMRWVPSLSSKITAKRRSVAVCPWSLMRLAKYDLVPSDMSPAGTRSRDGNGAMASMLTAALGVGSGSWVAKGFAQPNAGRASTSDRPRDLSTRRNFALIEPPHSHVAVTREPSCRHRHGELATTR
jgi:hypothetical protein